MQSVNLISDARYSDDKPNVLHAVKTDQLLVDGIYLKAGQRTGWKNEDVDLYELNEAFSVQSLGVIKELGLDLSKVNVNGGAVALGHPIGASGARVLVTLLYEMIRRDVHKGIAALCLGGGNSVAMAIER